MIEGFKTRRWTTATRLMKSAPCHISINREHHLRRCIIATHPDAVIKKKNSPPPSISKYWYPSLRSGHILHGGNKGNYLHAPWSLPWCPWNAPVEIYKFLIECSLPRRKCLGALSAQKLVNKMFVLEWIKNLSLSNSSSNNSMQI